MARQKQKLMKYQTAEFSGGNAYVDIKPDNSTMEGNSAVELTRQLQASDSIVDLMQTYSNTIQRLAPHDHLRFEHKSLAIDIQIGQSGVHRCTYNLFFSHYSLGRLSVSRNEKFSDDELMRLENTLCILFYPLEEILHQAI